LSGFFPDFHQESWLPFVEIRILKDDIIGYKERLKGENKRIGHSIKNLSIIEASGQNIYDY
jgi:hypothetical protein